MIFKQFYLPCLAHASYIIGDEATGTASVVDPILVYDLDVSDSQPHAVLTGDTLFVGDVGGPICVWRSAGEPPS